MVKMRRDACKKGITPLYENGKGINKTYVSTKNESQGNILTSTCGYNKKYRLAWLLCQMCACDY
jgi:hypothetical protein